MPDTRIEVAEKVLRAAGKLILEQFGRRIYAQDKETEPDHPVTRVDLTVDRLIVEEIQRSFPKDKIFTEETLFTGQEGDYIWIVDPVDGTSNLILGLPYVATGLAVQYAGETVSSVIYNPFLDEMLIAEKGSGAFLNGERLRVSEQTTPTTGYYVQGYRVPPAIQLEVLRILLPQTKRILQNWAPMLDWCTIARGRAEFLVGYDTEAEDLIQGKLIVEEAGGVVTTWDNRQLSLDLRSRQRATVLATNGAVHELLCGLLDRVSVTANLRGYIGPSEKHQLDLILELLTAKLKLAQESVPQRIGIELGIPYTECEHSSDLHYLVKQAQALQNEPEVFLRYIFDSISPHLSGEMTRKVLLQALERVAVAWNPGEHPIEIVAQALEIAASEVRLHDCIQDAGYQHFVVEELTKTLVEDTFAVGIRLKRNVFRQLWALEGINDTASMEPISRLMDLPLPNGASTLPETGETNQLSALIITAGRGTRLRTSVPKALIPLGKRPMLDYTFDALRGAGARHIAVVLGYKKELHLPILDNDLVILEQERSLGTGHAVMSARSHFQHYDGPLLVCYSDMPFIESQTLRAMLDKHRAEDALMTILTTSRVNHPEFGRILRCGGKVCHIGQVRFDAVESDEVDVGFYCFKSPEFWEYVGRIQNANNRREYVLTEIVQHLAEGGQKIATYFIDDFTQCLGINRPSELIQAERIAYVNAKCDALNDPDAALYWALRFYEAFGGIKADRIFRAPVDDNQRTRIRKLIRAYDEQITHNVGAVCRLSTPDALCCPC